MEFDPVKLKKCSSCGSNYSADKSVPGSDASRLCVPCRLLFVANIMHNKCRVCANTKCRTVYGFVGGVRPPDNLACPICSGRARLHNEWVFSKEIASDTPNTETLRDLFTKMGLG